jgi:superfamily I DNA/RNA helicase
MEKTAALLTELMKDSRKQAPDSDTKLRLPADSAEDREPSGAEILRRCPVPVIRSGGCLPEKGVFLITLAHAKGLEFDGVILPDANADNYPDTLLARHRLYTALSRATRRLTVLARGSLTPLLQDKSDQNKQN